MAELTSRQMKTSFVIATVFLSAVLMGCHRAENHAENPSAPAAKKAASQGLAKVTFQVDDPEQKAEGPSPYVHLADPQKALKWMRNPNEVVSTETELTVILDYPLRGEFSFPIQSASPGGFTRKELAQKISDLYKKVYEEEEKTSKIPVTPMDQRKGLINRNETNGKYGIWGHDLDDLDLSTIEISRGADGKVQASLEVDS